MKTVRRTTLVSLTLLIAFGLAGAILYRYWINPLTVELREKPKPPGMVDQQPLITAQRLAKIATAPEEQEFARNALRIADHEVDMAFASALYQATEHAPPIPAAALPIQAKLKTAQEKVAQIEQDVARLKQQLAKAADKEKPEIQDKLDLAGARLEVNQEDAEALHQELIRAGGDPRSKIQQLKDDHEALEHDEAGTGAKPPAAASDGDSRILLTQFRSWRQLAGKAKALASAQDELKSRLNDLAEKRQRLTAEVKEGEPAAEPTASSSAGQANGAPGTNSTAGGQKYAALRRAAGERRRLAGLDKRTSDFQQLEAVYGDWLAWVDNRRHNYLMGVVEGLGWIVALLLLLLFANKLVLGIVARIAPDSRRRHTVRIALRFAVQATALVLMLIVLFGPPSQLATVLALAGAGLTVALKDFIVGFFGWFILMGPNGIRPGDWVEINGIGGEVVEVGLLHTVILETGDWSDAGHPTGRKVTVVNSFAIEGHYFNFSSTGQWLWDQIEVPIPTGVDPYPIADAVLKAVVAETKEDVQLAEREWQRAVPNRTGEVISPGPAITVRPGALGVNVVVRYVTRAHRRHEVRSRLFREVVEILRSKHISAGPLEIHAAESSRAD